MRIYQTHGDEGSREQPSNGTGAFLDAARRRSAVIRRTRYAREHGLLEGTYGVEFDYDDKQTIADTAQLLADNVKTLRLSRQQIEADQQMDEDRMAGWRAAPPEPGTPGAEIVERLKYRMAVRAMALKLIAQWELAGLTSTVGHPRGEETPRSRRTPWTNQSYPKTAGAVEANRPGKVRKPRAVQPDETYDEKLDPGFDLPSEDGDETEVDPKLVLPAQDDYDDPQPEDLKHGFIDKPRRPRKKFRVPAAEANSASSSGFLLRGRRRVLR